MPIFRNIKINLPFWRFPIIANSAVHALEAQEFIELTLLSRGHWPNAENEIIWDALVKASKKEDLREAGQKWRFARNDWAIAEAFFLLGLYFNYELKLESDISDLNILCNQYGELIVETEEDSLAPKIDSFLDGLGPNVI